MCSAVNAVSGWLQQNSHSLEKKCINPDWLWIPTNMIWVPLSLRIFFILPFPRPSRLDSEFLPITLVKNKSVFPSRVRLGEIVKLTRISMFFFSIIFQNLPFWVHLHGLEHFTRFQAWTQGVEPNQCLGECQVQNKTISHFSSYSSTKHNG